MQDSYEGFIVHSSLSPGSGPSRLFLIGRLGDGRSFAVVEDRVRPGFYLRESDLTLSSDILERSGGRVEKSPFRTIDGEACVRLSWDSLQRFQNALQLFEEREIRTYEADIRLQDQFLMSGGIHGSVNIWGNPTKGRKVDLVFRNPELTPSDRHPVLSVLSLDIETNTSGTCIYAIGLLCDDPWKHGRREELLFCGPIERSDRITPFPDERSMLEAFCERIRALDPDIITGWNVIDFDFKMIAERIDHHRLEFQIGRSDSAAAFLPGERGRSNTIIVPGRQVIDAMRVVRASPERFSDYTLQTVAQTVLNRGKDLELLENERRPQAVERLYRSDPGALCRYCIEDTRLVIDILKKTGLLELTFRRCLLIGISLERVWTSIPSFEYLYIESMHRWGLVAPSPGVDPLPSVEAPGGAILEPRAGLYDNVAVFDFRSLYPSIIRTFNIDPVSFVPPDAALKMTEPMRDALIRAPNGACFRRESTILPTLLDRFFQSREEAKKAGDATASYVYKIIMNSFYGVMGAAGSRFMSGYISGAITGFGRQLLHWCGDFFSRQGYRVLYGDTDSIFILTGMPKDTPEQELTEMSRQLCRQVNIALQSYLSASYGVESFLELEFEKIYYKFFLPQARGAGATETESRRGRAKGYAGLLVPLARFADTAPPGNRTGCIEIVGMEAVRRDWTELARGFQIGLLELLFLEADTDAIRGFVHKVVDTLYSGGLDGQLVYRKALRKPVSAYTRSKPPHVRAAGMLDPEDQHGLIRYLWTTEGPQPEGRVTAPIDYEHYREKQLGPIARTVAELLGVDPELFFGDEQQLTLF
jgi:DNA polymerase-2